MLDLLLSQLESSELIFIKLLKLFVYGAIYGLLSIFVQTNDFIRQFNGLLGGAALLPNVLHDFIDSKRRVDILRHNFNFELLLPLKPFLAKSELLLINWAFFELSVRLFALSLFDISFCAI